MGRPVSEPGPPNLRYAAAIVRCEWARWPCISGDAACKLKAERRHRETEARSVFSRADAAASEMVRLAAVCLLTWIMHRLDSVEGSYVSVWGCLTRICVQKCY